MFAVVILVNVAFVALIVWSLMDGADEGNGGGDSLRSQHRNPSGSSRGENQKSPAAPRFNLPPSH